MRKFLVLGLLIGAICAQASTEVAVWDYGPDPHGAPVVDDVDVASWDYGPDPHAIRA